MPCNSMKRCSLLTAALVVLTQRTLSFCPLLQTKQEPLQDQMKLQECLRQCGLIITRTIERGNCQSCCQNRVWHRDRCLKVLPNKFDEVSKWKMGKKMKHLKQPWNFELDEGRLKGLI